MLRKASKLNRKRDTDTIGFSLGIFLKRNREIMPLYIYSFQNV